MTQLYNPVHLPKGRRVNMSQRQWSLHHNGQVNACQQRNPGELNSLSSPSVPPNLVPQSHPQICSKTPVAVFLPFPVPISVDPTHLPLLNPSPVLLLCSSPNPGRLLANPRTTSLRPMSNPTADPHLSFSPSNPPVSSLYPWYTMQT